VNLFFWDVRSFQGQLYRTSSNVSSNKAKQQTKTVFSSLQVAFFFSNILNSLCKCLILGQDFNQKNSSCPRILASEMLTSIRRLTSLLTVQTSERLPPPLALLYLTTSASRVDHLLNCIKGGGACHLREKVLAEAANTSVFSFSLS
jgi:Ribose 5-phosphate isomerase A (phosphoriboisomerase A)